jgi:hypothetical protein
MNSTLFEVRGYSDDGFEAVFGYAFTVEAAEYLVCQVAEQSGWHNAHYVKLTLH